MKKILKSVFAIALALCPLFHSSAALSESEKADSIALRQSLAKAPTRADSIQILYNLFDLTEQHNKPAVGWEIIDVAERTDNEQVLADMIPQMASILMKDENALDKLTQKTELIHDKTRRKGVRLFVDVTRAQVEAAYIPEVDRHDALIKYAKADMTPTGDQYADILDLYRMVIFLGQSAKGNFYLEYLDRLEKLISELPEENRFIRNLFYTQAAITHTNIGNHAKAIECDTELLKIIEQLDEKYKAMGRKYRNYDRFRYISYRRMLRNYKALTPQQIKEYYSKCVMLAERDNEVKGEFARRPRPAVYRMMAEKDYTGIIPNLQKCIETADDANNRREFLGMMVEVADSLHNNEALLPALKEYNALLAERLDRNSEEAYRELQMRYEVNKLRNENQALEIEKRDTEIMTRQKLVAVALAAVLALAIALMYLYRNYFRLRQRQRELRDENVRMKNQLENIIHKGFSANTIDVRKHGKE